MLEYDCDVIASDTKEGARKAARIGSGRLHSKCLGTAWKSADLKEGTIICRQNSCIPRPRPAIAYSRE